MMLVATFRGCLVSPALLLVRVVQGKERDIDIITLGVEGEERDIAVNRRTEVFL